MSGVRKNKPRGRPFAKGDKRAGRPKGSANKVTREAKALCLELLSDQAYMERFRRAWRSRQLPPRLEELVWAYAFGKPTQSVEVGSTFDHVSYLASKSRNL